MKQLDKVINACLKAINAKIPVLYLESDDLTLVDKILKSEKLATFWNITADDEWIKSKELTPDNIIYRVSSFDEGDLIYDQPYPLDSHLDAGIPAIYAIKNFDWEEKSIEVLKRVNDFKKLKESAFSSKEGDYIILQSPEVKISGDLECDVEIIDVMNLKKRYPFPNVLYAIEKDVINAKKAKKRIFILKDVNDFVLNKVLTSSTMFPRYHKNHVYGWVLIDGLPPENIRVTQGVFDEDFQNLFKSGKFSKRSSTFATEGTTQPWLKNVENVPYIIAVRNYIGGETNERKICAHISRYISSREDDAIRRCLIILQSGYINIPVGLESYVELIEVPPLSDDEIREIVTSATDAADKPVAEYLRQYIINLRGFNETKIRDILSRLKLQFHGLFTSNAIKQNKAIAVIRDVKTQLLKKEGLLELKDVDKTLEVSGLDEITEWLKQRVILFKDPIKSKQCWNINIPKGVLVSGIPGTGKSALAQQISIIFDLPLLKFDFGSILGRYTGESESNLRRVFKLAEKMSPCVLWIDELEKAFSSASSSGDSDGGQGKRLFGQFLTWMQEKKAACFIFATANDISELPSEFLRRGRFDQKFYTFMPTKAECVAIFKSVMRRYNSNDSKPFSQILSDEGELNRRLNSLLEECGRKGKFMQGSDIDGIVNDAMFSYFRENWLNEAASVDDVCTYKYSTDIFFTELKNAIDNVCTYGESDSTKMAICLLGLAYNKFRSASSDNNLITISEVDYKNIIVSEFSGQENHYDELLHELIRNEIKYLNEVGYNPETGKYDRIKR